MKKKLVDLWNWSYDQWIKIRNGIQRIYDFFYRNIHKAPKVASIRDTIQYVLDTGCSVSRFGDAEMKVLHHDNISYQTNSDDLCEKLIDVLNKPIPNHITCLIDAFEHVEKYDEHHRRFWRWHLSYYRDVWYKYLLKDRQYYNTHMSRCYMMYKDKSYAGEYFEMLKKIWEGKNILLVEGQKSRLGVGNDLFAECKQIKRVLGPQTSAYARYNDILQEVLQYSSDEWLIILALGPTACVLAYDLAQRGYQAIDIGNVDTEYEWYKMGALTKVPIPNKYVHEAGGGGGDSLDQEYLSQIVKVFV
jgi:glycosyltransferase family protein